MKNFQEMDFAKVLGFKGLKYDVETKLMSVYGGRLKARFGIEMTFNQIMEIDAITEWISEHDPRFEYHIENPYVHSKLLGNKPRLSGTFFIKITKATYIYVDVQIPRHRSDDSKIDANPVYMYIFGKKCYAVFNNISKYMKNKIKTENMLYSIVGIEKDKGASSWSCTATDLTPRSMDTVFMPADQKKRILDHLDKWVANEPLYRQRGLLYKTGILLHGPAGTGKTTLATAIADYLHCNLVTIDPTTFQYMNISEIVDSMTCDDETYVVLIDEIDTIGSRDDDDLTESKHDKISKLLSFLDSQQSPTKTVFVATTNYYKRLDEALLRPGRFAIIEEMKNLDKDLAVNMCKSFNLSDEHIEEIVSSIDTDINPDKLQDKILSKLSIESTSEE